MSAPVETLPSILPVEVEAKDKSRTRKLVARIAITVALLVLLFWQIPLERVWTTMLQLDTSLLFVALGLAIPTQYFQFLRWATLARQAGPDVSRADIHRGFWVGYTLGLVTPGRIGQYGRALALHNCSLSRAAGITFLERAYAGFIINGTALTGLVVLPLLGWKPPFPMPGIVAQAILVSVGMLFLGLGVFPRHLRKPLLWVAKWLPLRDKLARAISVLEEVTPLRGLGLMMLAALSLASSALQYVILLAALGSPVPVFAGMLAGVLNFFLKGNIPIAIGNLGVGEWTAVICLAGLGVNAETAVAASLLLFCINIAIPGLIGLPFVSTLRAPEFRAAKGVAA